MITENSKKDCQSYFFVKEKEMISCYIISERKLIHPEIKFRADITSVLGQVYIPIIK